jgi:Mlc titration factor MtfA (ptsG expression regulator)
LLYIILTIAVFIVVYKIVSPKKNKIVAVKIHDHWEQLLEKHVLFFQNLTAKDKQRFLDKVAFFLGYVKIEAVDFELEDLDILLVASSAIIPVFAFDNWKYPNIKDVILYPDYFNYNLEFQSKSKNKSIGGLVGTGVLNNKMILSRRALHHGFANKTDKGNTGVHEFVHLLDKLDGNIDGIPKALLDNESQFLWLNLIHEKMESINNDKSDIRNYGGTSKQEFFAVASEYFFERPKLLKRKHPELYKMLEDCFVV